MRNTLRWLTLALVPMIAVIAFGDARAMSGLVASSPDDALMTFLFIGAIGKASDLVIYQAEFQTGMVERINQFLNAFNEASRGAIRLVPRALKGHYSKEAFFKDISGLVTRRDITSTGSVTPLAMTQDEIISVKLNRKIGPVAQTLDALKKAGMSEEQASRAFGEQAGERKMRDMLNSALIAVESALSGVSANNLDITGESTKTASTRALQRTLAKMGDMSQDVVCWVSHSTPHFDIIGALMAQNVTGLTDLVTIQGAVPAYLGRPGIVTDSPALTDANGSLADTFNTLGLVRDAVTVEESEDETFFTDLVGGGENLYRLWQAEYAFNVKVKGFKWDTTGGGINPTDAALGTSSNWSKVAYDDKLVAGVRLVTQ